MSVVNRIAWSTLPFSTSRQRRSPGRIGSPAASADVQVSGRSRLLFSDHTAPDPADHLPPLTLVAHVSKSLQRLLSTTTACMSPPELRPPSILVSLPNG